MQNRHRAHNNTNMGVFSCSVCIGEDRKDAEHKKTPTVVSHRVQHVLLGVENMPSMKEHQ